VPLVNLGIRRFAEPLPEAGRVARGLRPRQGVRMMVKKGDIVEVQCCSIL